MPLDTSHSLTVPSRELDRMLSLDRDQAKSRMSNKSMSSTRCRITCLVEGERETGYRERRQRERTERGDREREGRRERIEGEEVGKEREDRGR